MSSNHSIELDVQDALIARIRTMSTDNGYDYTIASEWVYGRQPDPQSASWDMNIHVSIDSTENTHADNGKRIQVRVNWVITANMKAGDKRRSAHVLAANLSDIIMNEHTLGGIVSVTNFDEVICHESAGIDDTHTAVITGFCNIHININNMRGL